MRLRHYEEEEKFQNTARKVREPNPKLYKQIDYLFESDINENWSIHIEAIPNANLSLIESNAICRYPRH